MKRPGERNAARLGLLLAVFTLIGLLDAADSLIRHTYQPGQAFAIGLSIWYGWVPFAWLLFVLIGRVPIEQRNWPWRLGFYLAVGVAVVGLKLLIDWPIIRYLYCPEQCDLVRFLGIALKDEVHHQYLVVYGTLVGVIHALRYYQKYRERELKAAQLESRLTQAQLQLLKMQLHPHFLFNTLNAISALIHHDPEGADTMVARLGDLLRLSLERQGIHEVTLQEELEFIQAYLEIEQVRFGPRLEVLVEVEPEVLGARVPYLILQPLVENAIRHGLAPRLEGGCVAIRADRKGPALRLEVEDDGLGLETKPNGTSHGIGLSNTRARLEQLYGMGHRFDLGRGDLGGVLVSVEIPFAEDPVSGLDDEETVRSVQVEGRQPVPITNGKTFTPGGQSPAERD